MLHQLEQHSICRRWMNERYQTTTRTNSRRFINQARPAILQLRERRSNVFNLKGNVMHAGTAFR